MQCAKPNDNGVPPSCVLVFQHGLGSYIDRYDAVLSKIASEANAVIYAFDAHSHGLSEPLLEDKRCYFDRFQDLTDDLWQFVSKIVLPRSGNLPVYLGGVSLGGLVATYVLATHQASFAGLMLWAAALDAHWTPKLRVLSAMVGWVSMFAPRLQLVPAGFSLVSNLQSKINVPIMAVHGTCDKTTSLQAVQKFMESILIGPEEEEVLDATTSWLRSQASKAATRQSRPWWEQTAPSNDADPSTNRHAIFHLPAPSPGASVCVGSSEVKKALPADANIPWWDKV
eukprot:gene2211-33769_t